MTLGRLWTLVVTLLTLYCSSSFAQITDIDECTLGTHQCHVDAVCSNAGSPYACICRPGYEGDGFNCIDKDECEDGSHECHEVAICTNTPGSYRCECNVKFEGDGFNCTDKDECENGNHLCHEAATCTNTYGSYRCQCNEGYSGYGSTCADIDECANVNQCHDAANCTNTPGSYRCECNEGYEGNGINCNAITTTAAPAVNQPLPVVAAPITALRIRIIIWIHIFWIRIKIVIEINIPMPGKRDAISYGIESDGSGDMLTISPYCGLNDSISGTPEDLLEIFSDYTTRIDIETSENETECMSQLFQEFVGHVENGDYDLDGSELSALLGYAEAALNALDSILEEYSSYLPGIACELDGRYYLLGEVVDIGPYQALTCTEDGWVKSCIYDGQYYALGEWADIHGKECICTKKGWEAPRKEMGLQIDVSQLVELH